MTLSGSRQTTLRQAVRMRGVGYWSGRDVTVEFRPAPADAGRAFIRADSNPATRILVHVAHQRPAALRTNLSSGGMNVAMVEHLLAAVSGLGIDNCDIVVDAEEMPGFDGSCRDMVQALLAGGIVELEAERHPLVIRRTVRVGDAENWLEASPARADYVEWEYHLDYGAGHLLGRQSYRWSGVPEELAVAFTREIAPARTFLMQEDAQRLRDQGLGGHVTSRDLLILGPDGPLENQWRFPNECARHKLLDLMGDMALLGCAIQGRIVAHRSGHRLNADLVRAIMATHDIPLAVETSDRRPRRAA